MKYKRQVLKAFTLIEMIVVLAIVLLITAAVLFNTQSFNSAILLRSLAYEVGLSVREAQIYGVSVHATGGTFNAPYGIYMSATGNYGIPNSNYILFADLNADGQYDAGDQNIETFSLNNGFSISDFCVVDGAGNKHCASNNASQSPVCVPGQTGLCDLSITFVRPNPNANIMFTNPPGICSTNPSSCQSATINVSSPNGSTYIVSISQTGQISIAIKTNGPVQPN